MKFEDYFRNCFCSKATKNKQLFEQKNEENIDFDPNEIKANIALFQVIKSMNYERRKVYEIHS